MNSELYRISAYKIETETIFGLFETLLPGQSTTFKILNETVKISRETSGNRYEVEFYDERLKCFCNITTYKYCEVEKSFIPDYQTIVNQTEFPVGDI